MKKWLSNLSKKFDRWMSNRYGSDELGLVLIGLGLSAILIATFPEMHRIMSIAIVLIGFATFRCFSPNIDQRRQELDLYLKAKSCFVEWIDELSGKLQDRCMYRYVKCKNCGTVIRVPRGKGKVDVHCPRCGKKFTTRS